MFEKSLSKIEQILEQAKQKDKAFRLQTINKAKEGERLNSIEIASLFFIEKDEEENLFLAAREVKEHIYGNRIVFFAPLYTSNECINNCLYCGFRAANKSIIRKTLSLDETVKEAELLYNQGHRRLLLVCGEDKNTTAKHIYDAVTAIYENTGILRINVNSAPFSIEDFKEIKKAGIGTYQLFQETYHRETYEKVHISGIKRNYNYRLEAIERAFNAGIDDFGIGVLLGLYDYKYDVLASIMHAEYLENTLGVGPHTISIPRLREASGSDMKDIIHKVSDEELKKIVSIYRLALPYTGIILSTRESRELRDELLGLGVSQISAGSKTNPGGYKVSPSATGQFEIFDERSLDEMVESIVETGYLPSFCTACYRIGRTGEAFMSLAKDGHINKFCHLNSIITFKENIEQYANEEQKYKYNRLIETEVNKILDESLKVELSKRLLAISENGSKDLYF